MNFSKMHGLGNDFMVLDGRQKRFSLSPQQIKNWAARQTGVGFDQLLLIENGDAEHDFTYRIFNADGSEVEHCGNGARCFAHYLYVHGLHDFQKPVRVKIQRGSLNIARLEQNGEALYRVDMGQPRLGEKVHFQGYDFWTVDMGNPHAVLAVEALATAPVLPLAPSLQREKALFPASVNVGFMEILHPEKIRLRVYERGVGETLACGTGACAAVAAGIGAGLLARRVEVEFAAGGRLWIEWQAGEALFMLGDAVHVYRGQLDV